MGWYAISRMNNLKITNCSGGNNAQTILCPKKLLIVKEFIEGKGGFRYLCRKNKISPETVRSPESFIDNRGKNKPNEEMIETELLKFQIRQLEKENQELEMENDILKN